MQARWVTELEDYNLKIIPKAGKEMKKTDILSRQADYERGENEQQKCYLVEA